MRTSSLTVILVYILFAGCEEPAIKKQIVITASISEIKASSATGGGNVPDNGGQKIVIRGVVWDNNPSPTVSLTTRTTDDIITGSFDNGTGDFKSHLTGLAPGTKYYVRAYATNKLGTEYGEEIEFVTLVASTATVTTGVTNITWTSAELVGNVADDGGSSVTERGFVWNINPSPTTSLPTKVSNGSGLWQYRNTITGLTPGTKYYARSYTINGSGTGYGPEVTFLTQAAVTPIISTSVVAIGSLAAGSGGQISGDGGSAIIERGIVWSTSSSPTISLSTKTSDGTGIGSYTSMLTGLSPSTTYYVRAYATNATGTGYGQERSFVTAAGNVLYINTKPVSIDKSSVGPFPWDPPGTPPLTVVFVTGGGNIPDDGGYFISVRGVEYSTDPSLAGSSRTEDGAGIGEFDTNLTPLLTRGTRYYYRAYAITGTGKIYGSTGSVIIPNN